MESKLTALIVEDMPEALDLLKHDISTYCQNIEIIGTANSVVNAAKLIRQQEPDILFLDISLGDGTGFDLLDIFPAIRSSIIFTTAYEEYALRAFRISATDYLLKPIDIQQLKEAVQKVVHNKKSVENPTKIEILKESFKNPERLPSRISLHTYDKISIVTVSDIIRCEADGNNTWFFLKNKDKILVTKTLKYFEEILSPYNFIRTHQSHLVNFEFILEFSKKDGGFIKLSNGNEIPVSVRKKQEIIQILEKL